MTFMHTTEYLHLHPIYYSVVIICAHQGDIQYSTWVTARKFRIGGIL